MSTAPLQHEQARRCNAADAGGNDKPIYRILRVCAHIKSLSFLCQGNQSLPENIKRMIIQAVVATCLSPQTRCRFCFKELRKILEGKKRIRKCLSHHDCFKWYYIHVALLSVGHLLNLCSRQNGTHILSTKTSVAAWLLHISLQHLTLREDLEHVRVVTTVRHFRTMEWILWYLQFATKLSVQPSEEDTRKDLQITSTRMWACDG